MSLHPPVILFALLRTVTRHVLRGGPIRCAAFCGSIWCGLPSCNPCVIQPYLVPVVWILKVILTIRLARAFVRARRMRTAVRASNKDVRKNVLPAGSEQQTQWRLGPLLCRWSRLRAYNASRMWRAHGRPQRREEERRDWISYWRVCKMWWTQVTSKKYWTLTWTFGKFGSGWEIS